ncbi:hypothetical protein KKH23_01815 [Patescibacteria group bacterium]|nr:hypothetical protein [Patescibacteria group bacterium]MBU0845920.1 hypothetical protein [Patescibacteria group bacterium]MBU1844569.1 hypothetical protein [Patescibacteria group bacterium]
MKKIKPLFGLVKKNLKKNKYFSIITLLFIAVAVLVASTAFIKTAISESDYIYAKIKVSQGFWWASTQSPNVWFINSLEVGDTEYGLLGKSVAEVLEIRHYPTISYPKYQAQYDIFLVLKLAVSVNTKTQKYMFKRSTIGVGSPIELEFPSAQMAGSVIEISESLPKDELVEKDIIITKKQGYPWEAEAIKIGDEQFDGEEIVFKVTAKQAFATSLIDINPYGDVNLGLKDSRRYITVRGKIKVREEGDLLIFGEEQVVAPGGELSLATKNFVFDQFLVQEVK